MAEVYNYNQSAVLFVAMEHLLSAGKTQLTLEDLNTCGLILKYVHEHPELNDKEREMFSTPFVNARPFRTNCHSVQLLLEYIRRQEAGC